MAGWWLLPLLLLLCVLLLSDTAAAAVATTHRAGGTSSSVAVSSVLSRLAAAVPVAMCGWTAAVDERLRVRRRWPGAQGLAVKQSAGRAEACGGETTEPATAAACGYEAV